MSERNKKCPVLPFLSAHLIYGFLGVYLLSPHLLSPYTIYKILARDLFLAVCVDCINLLTSGSERLGLRPGICIDQTQFWKETESNSDGSRDFSEGPER